MSAEQRASGCRKCGSIYFAEPSLCSDCLAKEHAAALEQARREGADGEYRRGVEATFRAVEQAGLRGGPIHRLVEDTVKSLLSAPEAGDSYRELREAFVAGVKWRHGKVRGWSIVQESSEHEALRRWPLSAPGEVKHG